MSEDNLSRPLTKELEPPRTINKVHFLIHPGQGSDPRFDAKLSKRHLKLEKILLNKYVNKAKQMNQDELLFVFLHSKNPSELKEDLKDNRLYVQSMQEIKRILGKRAIFLSAKFDIFHKSETMETALSIAFKRGFRINPQSVESVAYGISAFMCVPEGAENLNISGGFNKPTLIIPELTELPFYPRFTELDIEKHIQKEGFTRVHVQEVKIPT